MMALARSALPRVSVCVAVAWSRHRFRNWGSTAAERALALPGDELIPDPAEVTTRAVSMRAPAESVWQWLVQIGQGRGGMYSYDARGTRTSQPTKPGRLALERTSAILSGPVQ
jgi:hypothetical protein